MANPHINAEMIGATKLSNPKDAIGDTKVPLWLCSAVAKAYWAAAQFAGLAKYGAWNWRAAGVRSSTYVSAMQRHLDAYTNGERLDPVDGTHHLGNVMACCAILLEAEAIGNLNDDRPPAADVRQAYAEVQANMAKLRDQYADKTPKHWTIADDLSALADAPMTAETRRAAQNVVADFLPLGGAEVEREARLRALRELLNSYGKEAVAHLTERQGIHFIAQIARLRIEMPI